MLFIKTIQHFLLWVAFLDVLKVSLAIRSPEEKERKD
jgi:hypothetical protein